ncbi:MAG: hypothetical protein GWP39_10960 [Planctomycetia bacterium]|nr:hypothetical protein [Planctomycetia bacterium]
MGPATGVSRGSTPPGTSGSGGSGRAGAAPYVPGESTLLGWKKNQGFHQAMNREAGSKKPMVVFLYSSSMNKDCCCANFERALFRDRDSVKEFKSWACYKQLVETLKDEDKKLLKQFDLRKDKPALLFFDSEGGLLHKQQLCVDPPKFIKVIRSTKKLSDMRLRLRKTHLAERKKAREHMEAGRYGKAIRVLDVMVQNRKIMSETVSVLVDQDLKEIESTAGELLIQASELKKENRLLDSYRLYEEIEKEFEKLKEYSNEASKHRKELLKKLRDLGL